MERLAIQERCARAATPRDPRPLHIGDLIGQAQPSRLRSAAHPSGQLRVARQTTAPLVPTQRGSERLTISTLTCVIVRLIAA